MLNGKGLLHLHDGTIFEGKFRQSTPIGKGTVKFADGSRFEGKWRDCASAKGKYTSASGESHKAEIIGGDLVMKRGFFSKREKIARLEMREVFQS